ncbi:MAG: hypothetical protein M3P40_05300 [Actinomycetota bacterium]|nr:hypothetical protein [Actinomycetota bacterium]
MGRALLAVITLLLLCIVGLGLSVYFTRGEKTYAVDNLLAEELGRDVATAEDQGRPVVLADITKFEWDQVLVVAKGTPRERIERALGRDFQGHINYDVESAELFVFVRDGELVRYADYRGRGRFTGVKKPIDKLTPATAVFEVRNMVARPAKSR